MQAPFLCLFPFPSLAVLHTVTANDTAITHRRAVCYNRCVTHTGARDYQMARTQTHVDTARIITTPPTRPKWLKLIKKLSVRVGRRYSMTDRMGE